MTRRHLWYSTPRFPRTAAEGFRDYTYGACIEKPLPRSLLASPWFWMGGAVSVALWVLLFAFVAGGGK